MDFGREKESISLNGYKKARLLAGFHIIILL